jgi:putative aldouronate transport system permease protein
MKKDKPAVSTSTKPRRKRWTSDDTELTLLGLPAAIWYAVFCYLPMFGLIIAFKNFKPALGFLGSPWVGLDNFTRFFTSPFFGRLVRNTLLLSFELLLFGFPAPIILALLINEVHHKGFKKSVQTLTYLPHFISLIVVTLRVKLNEV